MCVTPSRRVWDCASRMTLWALWYTSLLMALLSIAVMLVLVLRRVLQARREERRDALRAATSTALLAYLDGSGDEAHVLGAAGGQAELVGELVFQMRELVRGSDAARLVDLARATGGPARAEARLRRRNPQLRTDAVRHLAMYGADAAPLLTGCLTDPSDAVRITAAVELTRIGHTPRLEALAAAMNVGDAARSEELRQVFRPAVASDPREAVVLLEDEFSGDALRMLLLDGLAQAGALEALDAITALMRSPSAALRAEALRTLATLAHPSAAPAVIEALADPSWWVRAQAANAARRIGIDGAAEPLSSLLGDEQWWVRLRAAEALCALGPSGQAMLTAAASGEDHAARVAQLVLAEKGVV